jgi:hypothetical protein
LNPEWNLQSKDSKARLHNALKQMRVVYSDDGRKIDHLMDVCMNPWTAPHIKDILSGKKKGKDENGKSLEKAHLKHAKSS